MITTDVVVCGAGPVGTVAALLLAQNGVNVLVLESGGDCAQDLRASTFHPPTLEMLEEIGVTAMLLEKGLKAPIFQWRERGSGESFRFDLSEISKLTKYPFRIQCEQYHLSRELAQRLDAHPNAAVKFGHRLAWFDQDDQGITVHADTGTSIEPIAAKYLIGADGANSMVRKIIGTQFEGFTYPEKFLCFTTTEPLEEHLSGIDYVNYISDNTEWMVLLRVPSLWRVLVPADPYATDQELLSDRKKADVFARLIDKPDTQTHHRTIYRVHQRVAERWRDGRAIIIGDAAHLNNPLGGFGMNSGIHDAFKLCAPLVQALGGDGDAPLTEFERVRRQQTRDFVQLQTMQNMAMISESGGKTKHALRKKRMKDLASDPVARRAYLIQQSMIGSVQSHDMAA